MTWDARDPILVAGTTLGGIALLLVLTAFEGCGAKSFMPELEETAIRDRHTSVSTSSDVTDQRGAPDATARIKAATIGSHASTNDAELRNRGWHAYLNYNVWILDQRRAAFDWQARSGHLLFWVSILVTLTGLSFAFWQFSAASREDAIAAEAAIENEIQVKSAFVEMAFKTRSIAALVLAVSIIYLIVYTTVVYPLEVIEGAPSAAATENAPGPNQTTDLGKAYQRIGSLADLAGTPPQQVFAVQAPQTVPPPSPKDGIEAPADKPSPPEASSPETSLTPFDDPPSPPPTIPPVVKPVEPTFDDPPSPRPLPDGSFLG